MADEDPETVIGDPSHRTFPSFTIAAREYGLISTISEFYATLAQISFTLLGLWLVVVQMRRDEWARPAFRLGALAVTLHLAMPGMMSLLDLADPQSEELWRVSFAAFAAVGVAGVLLLGQEATSPGLLSALGRWGAAGLYVLVAVVALFAEAVESAFDTDPLQVEAVLLSLLLLLSLSLAVSMLFATPPRPEERPS